MKNISLCCAVLILPLSASAQVPSGHSGVSTETWGYNGPQQESLYSPAAVSCGDSVAAHAGLLGKRYVRAGYVHYGIDDQPTSQFDDSLQGFDIAFNTPVPWFTNSIIGTDLFAEYEHRGLSGSQPSGSIDVDQDIALFGVRLFAFPQSRFRPYVALGAGIDRTSLAASNNTGATLNGSVDDSAFLTNLGFEFDVASRLAARGDFEVASGDFDQSVFEGTLICWARHNVFLRGGIIAPLSDGFTTGGVIGGGVTF